MKTIRPNPVQLTPARRVPLPVVVARWRAAQVLWLRTALRMAQRDFADHLGLSARTVAKWEAGATPAASNQSVLDMALRRADLDTVRRFRALSGRDERFDWAAIDKADGRPEGVGWIVHLYLDIAAEPQVRDLAAHIARTVAALHPQVVPGVTTISPADADSQRRFVFCDRRIDNGGARCQQPHIHPAACW